MPLQLAADASLFLKSLRRFESLDGYRPSGFRSADRQFYNHEAAVVMRYVYRESPQTLGEARNFESAHRSSRLFGRFHPIYTHDISVLFTFSALDSDAETRTATLERFVKQQVTIETGQLVGRVEEVVELRDVYCGQPSRIYRLYWQSLTFALARRLCTHLQNQLRALLVIAFADRPLKLA